MNDFAKRYKNLSTNELMEIVFDSENYLPLAVEAAKKEIELRNLPKGELDKIKSETEYKQQLKLAKIQKKKLKNEELKNTFFSFLEKISPVQIGRQSTDKTINIITFIFGVNSLYTFVNQFEIIGYIFTTNWDFSTLYYIVSIISLPLIVIFFWLRKKIGWILLAIYLTFSSTTNLWLSFTTFGSATFNVPSNVSVYPIINPIIFAALLFFSVLLWVICKKDIRKQFQVTNNLMFQTIFISIALALIFMYIPYL